MDHDDIDFPPDPSEAEGIEGLSDTSMTERNNSFTNRTSSHNQGNNSFTTGRNEVNRGNNSFTNDNPPALVREFDYREDNELESGTETDLKDTSYYPIQIEAEPQKITEAEFDQYKLDPIDKKVLINELSDCDLYLKNIHKGFSKIASTNSLIKLVMAGIGVHKHRRQVLKELKAVKANKQIELDENGELIS